MNYLVLTLADITKTNVTRGEGLERDQQRNWETVLQVLGLRCQPIIIKEPTEGIKELPTDLPANSFFGEVYKGQHRIWSFTVTSENYEYTMRELEDEFNEVPIVTGLNETARFMLPIFFTTGPLKNIVFIPAL